MLSTKEGGKLHTPLTRRTEEEDNYYKEINIVIFPISSTKRNLLKMRASIFKVLILWPSGFFFLDEKKE